MPTTAVATAATVGATTATMESTAAAAMESTAAAMGASPTEAASRIAAAIRGSGSESTTTERRAGPISGRARKSARAAPIGWRRIRSASAVSAAAGLAEMLVAAALGTIPFSK